MLDREAATLRAAAEVFVPGTPNDDTPGAAEVEAERFIAHYLEYLIPGLARGVPDLLDELAATSFDGRDFTSLSLDERGAVLDKLAEHDVVQLRELPSLLGLLTVAAVYGEWSGIDEDGAVTQQPLGWGMTGFDGPVRGRTRLLHDQ